MTFVGSTSLSKAVGTIKSRSVGIQYSGSKISSDEPGSIPRSGIGSIQQTLEEYLPISTRSSESSLCIGDKGDKGTICVTCHVCFGGTGGKDDVGGRDITFESRKEGCDVFFTNKLMLLEMSFLTRD